MSDVIPQETLSFSQWEAARLPFKLSDGRESQQYIAVLTTDKSNSFLCIIDLQVNKLPQITIPLTTKEEIIELPLQAEKPKPTSAGSVEHFSEQLAIFNMSVLGVDMNRNVAGERTDNLRRVGLIPNRDKAKGIEYDGGEYSRLTKDRFMQSPLVFNLVPQIINRKIVPTNHLGPEEMTKFAEQFKNISTNQFILSPYIA